VDAGPQFHAFLTSVVQQGRKFHTLVPVFPIHTSEEGCAGSRSQPRHYGQQKPFVPTGYRTFIPRSSIPYPIRYSATSQRNTVVGNCGIQWSTVILTLILLTWRIWRAPNNASRWQMGFNSAFKRLRLYIFM